MTALHCWMSSCSAPWDQMKAMQTSSRFNYYRVFLCAFVFMICTGENGSVYGFAWPYIVHGACVCTYKPQDASRCSAPVNPQQRSEHLPAAGFSYWPQPSRECQMERRREGGGCFVWKPSAWDTMLPHPLFIRRAKELVVISRSKQGQRRERAKWNGVFLQASFGLHSQPQHLPTTDNSFGVWELMCRLTAHSQHTQWKWGSIWHTVSLTYVRISTAVHCQRQRNEKYSSVRGYHLKLSPSGTSARVQAWCDPPPHTHSYITANKNNLYQPAEICQHPINWHKYVSGLLVTLPRCKIYVAKSFTSSWSDWVCQNYALPSKWRL